MPATLSASGTWTPIPFTVTTEAAKTGANTRMLDDLNLSQFVQDNHPETEAMIQLVADGYGIGFEPAALLLRHLLSMVLNRFGTQPALDVVA